MLVPIVAASSPTSMEFGMAWNNCARMLCPSDVLPRISSPACPAPCFGGNAPDRSATGPTRRAPTTAITSSTRKMPAPTRNLRLPSRTLPTLRASRCGGATSSATGTTAAMSASSGRVANARIDQGIGQIEEQIGDRNGHDDEQDPALDHREVEALDTVEDQVAETRIRKDGL